MIVALAGNPFYDYQPRLFGQRGNGARFGLGGDGDSPSTGQVIGASAVSGAAAGIATGMATGSVVRGTAAAVGATITALSPLAGPFAPLVAGFGVAVSLFSNMFHGCGQSCVDATNLANQAQKAWQAIKDQYFAMPVRTVTDQANTLAAMDYIWQQLKAACDQPGLADAGQRCWTERQCNPAGKYAWCPTFRDPVANDPDVKPDPISLSSSPAAFAQSIGLTPAMAALALAAVVAGVMLL